MTDRFVEMGVTGDAETDFEALSASDEAVGAEIDKVATLAEVS